MNDFILYGIAQSGNCYKPALMLSICDAQWHPKFVDYFNGETRTPEFRTLNPMGEIPVLVHGEKTISQSGVILTYLQQVLNQFGAANPSEERELLRWLLFDNHKLTSYCGTLRYLRTFTDQGENEVTRFFEGRAKGALTMLNEQLTHSAFVVSDHPTIADFSLCGYLYFQEEIGINFSGYTEILRWLDEISSMKGWAHPYDLMPGHPLPKK